MTRESRPAIAVAVADLQTSMVLSPGRLRRAVRAALAGPSAGKAAGRPAGGRPGAKARISLAVVDDPVIARLNRQFLHHRGATDVLSFVLERRPGWLEAEIVVSAETARREARHYGARPQDELLLYVVHGALHLAGYDDRSAGGRARMWARQRTVMAELGVKQKDEGGRMKDE
ncbi:MAG: rRNA maturation RNase YbeY [Thermoguttaceae bacterium]